MKINKFLIIALLTVTSVFTSCSKTGVSVFIVQSFGFFDESNEDYQNFLDIAIAAYITSDQRANNVIIAGPYSDMKKDISEAETIYAELKQGLQVEPYLDKCSFIDYQVYNNLKNILGEKYKDLGRIEIATDYSRYPKTIIESFLIFQANDEQKIWVKDEIINGFKKPIDQREKILDQIIDKIWLWQEKADIDIKIHRMGFETLTQEKEDHEKLETTFIEILSMFDEEAQNQYMNDKLSQLSGETKNFEAMKSYLISKGCLGAVTK
jgi:hypothetical protein